jgi:hypothetical protein
MDSELQEPARHLQKSYKGSRLALVHEVEVRVEATGSDGPRGDL